MGDVNTPDAGRPPGPTAQSLRTDAVDAPTSTVEPGTVHVIVGTSHARVVLSGEIDADLSPDLQQATLDVQAAGLPIEIDAHHVTFMDSTGVAFLGRLASVASGPVRILNTPPTVRFLLEVTSIGSMLEIVEDEPTAADYTTDLQADVSRLPLA